MLCLASILSFCAASLSLWLGDRVLAPPMSTAAHAAAWSGLVVSLLFCAVAYARERAAKGTIKVLPTFARSLAVGFVGLALWRVTEHLQQGLVFTLLAPLMQVTAPAVWALGVVPALAKGWALFVMRQAPVPEGWRVTAAGRAAHIVVLSCITFAALNLTSLTYNRKWDLSYFKITQVSPRTKTLAASLNQDVAITLFFPPGNDVLQQVRSYFDELAPVSAQLSVTVLDQATEPARARALKARRNGTIAVHSGSKTELLHFDLDVEQARGALRRLDGDVYRQLLAVTEPPSIVYVTDGHGERSFDKVDAKELAGLHDFKTLLEGQGMELRPLGLAEGLGQAIPHDASCVAIMGPTQAFSAVEIQALTAYLARGGHLLLCLDPDRDNSDNTLAALAQTTISRTRVGNPHYQVAAQGQGANPFNLVTVRVAGHPSVQSLEAHPGRLGLVLLGAASIGPLAPADVHVTFTPIVQAMPDSFTEGDRTPKQNIVLAAAVQWPSSQSQHPARAIVVGDVDLATDGILRNVGNSYFISDTVNWLVHGNQAVAGGNSEEDVPLVHRKDKDGLWFYGVSFGMPVLVLALGLFVHERDRKRMRRPHVAAPHASDKDPR